MMRVLRVFICGIMALALLFFGRWLDLRGGGKRKTSAVNAPGFQ